MTTMTVRKFWTTKDLSTVLERELRSVFVRHLYVKKTKWKYTNVVMAQMLNRTVGSINKQRTKAIEENTLKNYY